MYNVPITWELIENFWHQRNIVHRTILFSEYHHLRSIIVRTFCCPGVRELPQWVGSVGGHPPAPTAGGASDTRLPERGNGAEGDIAVGAARGALRGPELRPYCNPSPGCQRLGEAARGAGARESAGAEHRGCPPLCPSLVYRTHKRSLPKHHLGKPAGYKANFRRNSVWLKGS